MKSSTWVTIALLATPHTVATQAVAPAPDASRLKLGVDSLAVFLIQARDTVRTGIIVDELAVDSTAGTPRLVRVYWSQDRVLGQRVDTIVDAFTTLQPIAFRSRASTGFQFLDFTPSHVTGWLRLSNGDSVGIDRSLPQPVYNAASFDLVLRASALRDSVAFTVPGFLATTRSVTPLSARVVGRGTIAGRACWVVRAEFAGMPVTFWIDVETRHLRQQVMQVRQDTRLLFTTLRSARTGRRATERPQRSGSYTFAGYGSPAMPTRP